MRNKFDGKLSEWFINAKEDELVFLDVMSPGSVGRLCQLLRYYDRYLKNNISTV